MGADDGLWVFNFPLMFHVLCVAPRYWMVGFGAAFCVMRSTGRRFYEPFRAFWPFVICN